ncbi:MAG: hypothetical protein AAB403_15550 [Planctomycetota bacterium]|mgnify:CR=1 FL=1
MGCSRWRCGVALGVTVQVAEQATGRGAVGGWLRRIGEERSCQLEALMEPGVAQGVYTGVVQGAPVVVWGLASLHLRGAMCEAWRSSSSGKAI